MLTQWCEGDARPGSPRARPPSTPGVSKHRVHVLTGIGRSTIDRIVSAAPAEPACVQPLCSRRAEMTAEQADKANRAILAKLAWSGRRLRDLNPGWA